MAKKAEDRSLADRHLLLRQASLQLRERDVRLPGHPLRDPFLVPLQDMTLIATTLRGTDAPGASPTCEKSAYRTDTYTAEAGGLLVAVA
jgi:hypothetical protein